jgi:hypothetical protein
MGNGQWAMGNGQWAMGNGQWAIMEERNHHVRTVPRPVSLLLLFRLSTLSSLSFPSPRLVPVAYCPLPIAFVSHDRTTRILS